MTSGSRTTLPSGRTRSSSAARSSDTVIRRTLRPPAPTPGAAARSSPSRLMPMTMNAEGRAMPSNPLTAYELTDLRERRSVKWREYPPDVLPMFVAERDTPLAEPVAAALTGAIARGDTGYAAAGRLPEAFADFAADRYGWRPAPDAIRLVPDVMYGVREVMEIISKPGDRVVVNTP